jgi:hypothetical protein
MTVEREVGAFEDTESTVVYRAFLSTFLLNVEFVGCFCPQFLKNGKLNEKWIFPDRQCDELHGMFNPVYSLNLNLFILWRICSLYF